MSEHAFKWLVMNVLYLLLFEEDMGEAEWYKRLEEVKKQMERLFISVLKEEGQ